MEVRCLWWLNGKARYLIIGLLALLVEAVSLKAAPIFSPPSDLLAGCWVAYAPTNFAPPNFYPTASQIGQDLNALRAAGFTGLVTYGSERTLGTEVPREASEKGLKLVMGIYNPDRSNPVGLDEFSKAVAAKDYVVGYVVGNEGLDARYDRATLVDTIDDLRAATGKPVTTTEEWFDYVSDSSLLDVGDWVFPNVHPYYATPTAITDPAQAANWTQDRYDDLDALTTQKIVFKEVGLPSAGGPNLNEANQAEYYRRLRWETNVQFVYFEAFDQPWKIYINAAEPHWGLFTAGRVPKPVRQYACGGAPGLLGPAEGGMTTSDRPTFRWGSTGAANYEMQLYTTDPPGETVVNAPVMSYTPICALLTRTYYWRVRGIDAAGHALDWSSTRTLAIQSLPNAAARRNHYTIATPTLTWNRISWATQYELQVGCDLNSPLHDLLVSASALSHTTPPLLNGYYNWRVRAQRSDGLWGLWSPVESFMVDVP